VIEAWSCGGMVFNLEKRCYNKFFGYGPSPGSGAGIFAKF